MLQIETGFPLQKFTSNGQLITRWDEKERLTGKFIQPIGVAVDGKGDIYIADSHLPYIQKLNAKGEPIAKWNYRGFSLAVDKSGNVYVADYSKNRIRKFSADGQLLAEWGGVGHAEGEFKGITGIAASSSGEVYVIDSGNYRIQVFCKKASAVSKSKQE